MHRPADPAAPAVFTSNYGFGPISLEAGKRTGELLARRLVPGSQPPLTGISTINERLIAAYTDLWVDHIVFFCEGKEKNWR